MPESSELSTKFLDSVVHHFGQEGLGWSRPWRGRSSYKSQSLASSAVYWAFPRERHHLLTGIQPWFLRVPTIGMRDPHRISELRRVFTNHLLQWLVTFSGSQNFWESEVSWGLWASGLGTTRGAHTQFCIKFQEIHTWVHPRASWESVPPRSRAPSLFYFYDELRKVTKTFVILVWVPKGRKPINNKISIRESHLSSERLRSTRTNCTALEKGEERMLLRWWQKQALVDSEGMPLTVWKLALFPER